MSTSTGTRTVSIRPSPTRASQTIASGISLTKTLLPSPTILSSETPSLDQTKTGSTGINTTTLILILAAAFILIALGITVMILYCRRASAKKQLPSSPTEIDIKDPVIVINDSTKPEVSKSDSIPNSPTPFNTLPIEHSRLSTTSDRLVYFFTTDLTSNEIMDFIYHKLLATTIDIIASEDYESESDSELKLTKGDIIQVYEHQYNGWCLGQNKTTDKVGLIPVQCIVPQSPKLYIVDCEQTQFSLPKVLEYVITVFPENIKLVRLDMTQVQGSLKDLFALEKFNPDMVGLFAGSVEFEERMERELHLFWISVEAGKV
ncbi:hypothetical protein BC833DRAFT_617292 [Globomyces pollinis-pini]|nr:hypothetical protein BC833DRAFT_617292 [Globomyces pollinis-pini]